ncbi:MAG: hypothetical protein WDO73_27160 [Ignavibacteriota bacterium]
MTATSLDFNVSTELREDLKRWRSRSLAAGIAGVILFAVGFVIDPTKTQSYLSYLWAYLYIVGLSVGSLAWLMLQYITGGNWGIVIRRPCEAAARTLPLVGILFVPIIVGMHNLYPWSVPSIVATSPDLQQKQLFLNVPFFLGRCVVYLGGWTLIGALFSRWSRQEDVEGHDVVHGKFSSLAPPGLIFWALSVTFMAIDWVLSMNPQWFSTMFGLLFMASQGLTAMAFLITLMIFLYKRKPMSEVLTARHLHDLGKFLLALVMVWAYFSFSQFLIIWAGNLPEEIPWYLVRINNGWGYVALALVFGHFALPFALLLSRDIKRNFNLLWRIAIFILLMRLVDLYWIVVPDHHKQSFSISLTDFAAPLALIGIWLWYFFTQLEKRPLMPINNPHLEEALEHGRE